MLKIIDSPGRRPSEEMRELFEGAVQNNSVLSQNTSLAPMTLNGKFSHYVDPDTDTLWIGFALGMRGSDQLAARAASAGSPQ